MEPVFQVCPLNKILIPRLANNKEQCYNLPEESEMNDKLGSSVQDLVLHSEKIRSVHTC